MTGTRYDCRQPKRTEGFAWGRSIDKALGDHILTYRPFRRDHRRAMHMHAEALLAYENRAVIAGQLRRRRRVLSHQVDDIDMVALRSAASRGIWIAILALWCHRRSSWQEATHFFVERLNPVFQTMKVVLNGRNLYVRRVKTATANRNATAYAPEAVFDVKKLHTLRLFEDIAIRHKRIDGQRILTNPKKIYQRPERSLGENLRQKISLKTVHQDLCISCRLQVHHPALVLSSLSLELTKQPCVYLSLSMKISHQRDHAGNETDHPSSNRGGYACIGGNGIPPHHAVIDAQRTAPKNSIKPLHSMIPLWTRRHSAMQSRRAENCHG